MKIAITLMRYNPFGGYERQAAALAQGLAARGDYVTVFAHVWMDQTCPGIRFEKVPMITFTPWLRSLSFAIMARRTLRQHDETFDLVIAFDRTLVMDIYRAGNACHREWIAFRKKHLGLYSRISIAMNPLHPVTNWIEEHMFGYIQKHGGSIVGLSPLNAKQVRTYYPVDRERFHVIPPAVDLKRFDRKRNLPYREEIRRTLAIDEDTLLLLHVGSGFRIKGLISTIRTVPILRERGMKVALVVAGKDRSRTTRYRKQCRQLGIDTHVQFLGGIRNIERYYAAADIFVLPSLFETFGVSAIEALASGLPVIIGKGAGVSPIITPVGRTIDVPAAPAALASMIEETANEEFEIRASNRIETAYHRRREVALQCGMETIMSRYYELIDSTVKEKHASD